MENPKFEYLNPKQTQITKIQNSKQYDLESRTFKFAEKTIQYVNTLPKTLAHIEIGKQLVRAAGSTGANYIEANEALSKKDFIMRIKISRKESKECRYWLGLTQPLEEDINNKLYLMQESLQLTKIFGSILEKSK